jgi:hypothetical protein
MERFETGLRYTKELIRKTACREAALILNYWFAVDLW